MPEISGQQIITKQSYDVGVSRINNAKLRRMRKDPVIALVRFMFFAGILSGEWSYEGEDPDQVQFIKDQLEPMRRHILATGALGCFDYGWQPYEKVFEIGTDGLTRLVKLKPLIQDNTAVVSDQSTGAFIRLENGTALLDVTKCLLLNFDVEGTDWTGTSTLENAEKAYDDTLNVSKSAKRFDEKMAGAHWIVRYPDGKTNFNGVETPNHEIADALLSSLQSSGLIAIPISQALMQSDVFNEKLGWHIELISASGASVPFEARFEYLDKCKARSLGFPERTLLEGQHGTLAEAGAHQDFVLTLIEYRHDCLLELINWHVVNQLLRFNYGPEADGLVTIKAAAINDISRATISKIYDTVLANPDGFLAEFDKLDMNSIADQLGIPQIQSDAIDPTLPPMPAPMPVDPNNPVPTPVDPNNPVLSAPGGVVQDTALNGAQVGSLVDIATQVVQGILPKDSAKAIIAAAFPAIDQSVISAIVDPLLFNSQPANGNPSPSPAPVKV